MERRIQGCEVLNLEEKKKKKKESASFYSPSYTTFSGAASYSEMTQKKMPNNNFM
jgi:hypothetical protein